MQGQGKPDFQVKKATGKRNIAPIYQRHKQEQLHGVGMLVVSQNDTRAYEQGGVFNK